VLVTGRRLARPEAMLAWSRHAEAYIRRAGDELQHARLQTNRALGAFLNPTWGDARARVLKSPELHLEALRTYEATPGAEVDRGRALMAIAETYEGESRERSSEYYDRSLQTYEALCPDHPAAALVRSARGRILLEADRLDEAQAEYEKGKAILEATVGTRHRSYAFILGGLAHLHEVRDHWAEAEPLVRRAIEIHTASEGKAHLNTMEKRTMLGHVLMKLGRVDESIAEFESVLDDIAANPDVRPYELANLVAYAIDTFIAAERPADLLARVAPLFAAVERATPKDKVIPSLLFNRARLKLAAGAPLAEARADALQARANAEAMQVPPQVLAEFDAWLAKHPEK
jgi:tetratricopeptide (TPR) repeat protein